MIYLYIYIHIYMNEKWRDMETVDSSEDSEELLKEDCFFFEDINR